MVQWLHLVARTGPFQTLLQHISSLTTGKSIVVVGLHRHPYLHFPQQMGNLLNNFIISQELVSRITQVFLHPLMISSSERL